MRCTYAALSLFAICQFACTTPSGEASLSPIVSDSAYADQFSEAESKLVRIREATGVAGLSAALAVDGEIVWSRGFGVADMEKQVPMTADTKMRVGSVAKPITSVALAELVERGQLDWDADVQQYAQSFPSKRWPVTVRQVATHTAGVRHYRGAEFLMAEHFDSVEEALTVFAEDPLLFEPGTRYSYSSYGYNLLSSVAEGAAGKEFLPLMLELVFSPLGLNETTADQNFEIVANRTEFYDLSSGELKNAPYVDNSVKWAGGGFLSTANDLVRFGSGLLAGTVLERATLEEMWTPATLSNGEQTTYGLGWSKWDFSSTEDPPEWSAELIHRESASEVRLVGHTGGSMGGVTAFVVAPDDGVVAAAISNTSGVPDLGQKLLYVAADLAADVALAKR